MAAASPATATMLARRADSPGPLDGASPATPATSTPAWQADHRPIYGGFFWINGTSELPVPREAYDMSGAGGKTTLIIPSHDLVVVRLGHFKGSDPGDDAFKRALPVLMNTVPKRQ